MSAPRATLVADVKASLGESPVWHERSRTLYHVDINGKKVWSTRGDETALVATLPGPVGCVVPRASGGVLACLERGIVHVDVTNGAVSSPLASVPSDHIQAGMRYNDGKVDPTGRHLFVGTMHGSWRDPAAPTGRLYRYTCDAEQEPGAHLVWGTRRAPLLAAAAGAVACALAVSRARNRSSTATAACATLAAAAAAAAMAAETVAAIPAVGQPRWSAAHTVVPVARVPNGMAWTADQRTLFWIDSALNTVDVFDYDPSSGEASNRRVAVTCLKQGQGTADGIIGGIPDGATIDAAGKLWVALAESGHVVQYDPHTGKQLMAVALPVQRVTACTFGGDDLSELFVTTREETGPGASPHAGGLFKLHLPGVRGLHGAYEMQG